MIDVVLTDIEGTTSSIAVVTRHLFPYARARLRTFLARHENMPDVQAAWTAARETSAEELRDVSELASILERWSDEDRKIGPLKVVQGLIWEQGFRAGELHAHVFGDVPPALREWRARGRRLAVFSSGSVRAQRVFFGHTDRGDLEGLFDAFFDTQMGAKGEPAAYEAIARELAVSPPRILFLSDVEAELQAARTAGMHAIGIARDGSNALDPWKQNGGHVADRFDAIDLDGAAPVVAPSRGTLGAQVARLARYCHRHGWCWATSGNFSARLSASVFSITASGIDKGDASSEDLMLVDLEGAALEPSSRRPSAETPLHAALYRARDAAGAIAHTHSIATTVLSRRHAAAGSLTMSGYEMAKALTGVTTHDGTLVLPIVPNDQDTQALARAIEDRLRSHPSAPAYLIEGHGMTTWAADVDTVRRHVEAIEFLLACELANR